MNISYSDLLRSNVPQGCEILFAFVAGSTVEGFANPSSDVDLYVVLKDGTGSPAQSTEHGVVKDGKEIDVTLIPHHEVRRIVGAISCGWEDDNSLTHYDLLLAHRLFTAVPIEPDLSGDLSGIQNILSDGLGDYVCKNALLFAGKCLRDGLGNVEAGDFDSAIFNANRAINSAFDAALAAAGNTSVNPKWRSRIAAKLFPHDAPIICRFNELAGQLPCAGSNFAKMRYVGDAARYLQGIIDGITLQNLSQFKVSNLEYSRLAGLPPLLTTQAVLKHAKFRLAKVHGAYYLIAVKPVLALSDSATYVWLAVNNERTSAEAFEWLKGSGLTNLSEEQFHRNLEKLRQKGVLL